MMLQEDNLSLAINFKYHTMYRTLCSVQLNEAIYFSFISDEEYLSSITTDKKL
jgi:hypothetical protein